jgi:hypothetical protein
MVPATQIAEAIFVDVARFQDAKDRFDDETILVKWVRYELLAMKAQ